MDPDDRPHAEGLSAEAMEKLAREIHALESEGYEVDNWVLHPGEAYRTQVSNEDKILAVLKGSVHIETPLESRELMPGDVYSIPHGLVHSITPEEGGDVYILVAHREPPPIPPEAFRNRSDE
jgi:mannose-6-phosphate isomerase-like protein (cupin superfamily)